MGFEFKQGWMNEKTETEYGKKDGTGKGVGKGGLRRNKNTGDCAEGGEGHGEGGGQGGGKNRLE